MKDMNAGNIALVSDSFCSMKAENRSPYQPLQWKSFSILRPLTLF